jgi:glycogen debranching enzyme
VTDEIIRVQDEFYILATSSRMDEHARVLKHGDTFALADRLGNIQRVGLGEQGVYHADTRFLSRWELRLLGRRPLLLSSTVSEDNAVLRVDLTNPDHSVEGRVLLPRDTVHVARISFLWNDVRYERLRLRSYLLQPVELVLSLDFEADFADIFEVRGARRERRGELLPPVVDGSRVQLSYRGLDDGVRRTTLAFSPAPDVLRSSRAEFHCALPARDELALDVSICCEIPASRCTALLFDRALDAASAERERSRAGETSLWSSSEPFNEWLHRSSADLQLMLTQTPDGPYPYAGVPWFSTFFGRDGIITALESLWTNPAPARGVLGHLAREQATGTDAARDAEPGKILHESRGGEMAALGEVPFGRYYGSVDATPLFVMLAGAYDERTGDLAFTRGLWPHVEAALQWIDCCGDVDGDGFVEYARRAASGLAVQGWKDSVDSVFHADGTPAEGPVALCEVQAYVYAARVAAARMAARLGLTEQAASLSKLAEELRVRFEEAFWCEELSTYALALDGAKRPCRVRTSNAGHCLYAGIASTERARRVATTLLDEASFSGWGVRTVAATEARYNPMAYHNGSVWPHDNALIAAGLARYGLMPQALRVFSGLFDASRFFELHRMPELFCGFARRPGEGPTLYPVACAPQSWAAAAAHALLQSLLGLSIDAPGRAIRFQRPVLPEALKRLWIRGLRVGEASLDIYLERSSGDVAIELLRRDGDVDVHIVK